MDISEVKSTLDGLNAKLVTLMRKAEAFPPEVWHYTTTGALLSMLESHRLWGTDYRYLNDPTEQRICHDLLGKQVSQLPDDDSLPGQLRRRIAAYLEREQQIGGTTFTFVASFSTQPDLLSQWRAYGGDGAGVAVAFDLEPLRSQRFGEGTWTECLALTMGYDEREVRFLVENAVSENAKLLAQMSKAQLPEHLLSQILDRAMQSVVMMTGIANVQYKHEGYAEESEVRLVCIRTRDHQSLDDIKFRTRDGMAIPYVEFGLGPPSERRPLPITEIKLGPRLGEQAASIGLNAALAKHGYHSRVKVTRSNKAYR